MKKMIPIILSFILIFCSCNTVSNNETTTEQSPFESLYNKILVVISYDNVNLDYSVYQPAYFGDAYSECKIYDLYANYGLCLTLALKTDEVKNAEKHINELLKKEDIFTAELCTADKFEAGNFISNILTGLTEYTPEKSPVRLCNRRFPFTTEFTGFDYDRNYRLIYYDYSVIEFDFISSEERDQWREYYDEFNGLDAAGSRAKEPKEMSLVSFIKYFDIPKEVFEAKIREVEKYRMEEAGDAFRYHTEQYELPNADILYTFDNDIINEYYSYK